MEEGADLDMEERGVDLTEEEEEEEEEREGLAVTPPLLGAGFFRAGVAGLAGTLPFGKEVEEEEEEEEEGPDLLMGGLLLSGFAADPTSLEVGGSGLEEEEERRGDLEVRVGDDLAVVVSGLFVVSLGAVERGFEGSGFVVVEVGGLIVEEDREDGVLDTTDE